MDKKLLIGMLSDKPIELDDDYIKRDISEADVYPR